MSIFVECKVFSVSLFSKVIYSILKLGSDNMKVYLASDHAGYEIKEKIANYLKTKTYEVMNLGTDSKDSVDYPDYAYEVGTSVRSDQGSLGILVCGTGIGMSIACNKIKNIRCAKVDNVEEAKLSKLHNNANVLALSSHHDDEEIKQIVDTFLTTPFSEEERHIRRLNKISEYEDSYEC